MTTSLRVVASLLLIAAVSGCQLAAGYLATDFSLSAEPPELTLARGSSEDLTVHVDRILPIDASPFPVLVTLHRAPDGVTLEAGEEGVQIPSGIDEEILTLQASADAVLGEHEATLRGTNMVRAQDVDFVVTIVDAP